MSITLASEFVTQTCCYKDCGVTFAMTRVFDSNRRNDHEWWYCPNGHRQHYTGASDADKLRRAEAREVALNDQLRAAIRDADETRSALLRDRSRFAAGVCPCCNRSFENVRRHMTSKHPDFAVDRVAKAATFKCSCGRKFDTYRGLRVHQGWSRTDRWDEPEASSWEAHLTRT